jgi:hypothetical protein
MATDASPLEETFATAATADDLEQAAQALRQHGFDTHVVTAASEARELLNELIPAGARVLTAASETLRSSGIDADINESGRFEAVRPELVKLDFQTQPDARRQLAAAPDVVVGSVQAITHERQRVAASATGSQLGPIASGAGRVILIAGRAEDHPRSRLGPAPHPHLLLPARGCTDTRGVRPAQCRRQGVDPRAGDVPRPAAAVRVCDSNRIPPPAKSDIEFGNDA